MQLVDRHQISGLAVDDDFRNATGRRGDHRQTACHGFQIHDAERLVDGWQMNASQPCSSALSSGFGSISSIQMMLPRSSSSLAKAVLTSSMISGVSGAPAHRTTGCSGPRSAVPEAGTADPFDG